MMNGGVNPCSSSSPKTTKDSGIIACRIFQLVTLSCYLFFLFYLFFFFLIIRESHLEIARMPASSSQSLTPPLGLFFFFALSGIWHCHFDNKEPNTASWKVLANAGLCHHMIAGSRLSCKERFVSTYLSCRFLLLNRYCCSNFDLIDLNIL